MKSPASLHVEHEALHARLVEATRLPGRTGAAARAVASVLHPHFLREEEFAVPPLGLLPQLARGEVTQAMADALPLVARLREDLPQMLEEHRAIVQAVTQLATAATEEGRHEWVEFAEELRLHAQMEEEVLYPAAILVGEYLKGRLKR